MFDVYRICIFIGLYLLTLAIGIGNSYYSLKKGGIVSSVSLVLKNSAIVMGIISTLLLFTGIYLYNFII